MICFCCGQVHMDSGHDFNNAITLSTQNSRLLHDIKVKSFNPEAVTYNFDLDFFVASYAAGASNNPWRQDPECLHQDWEWRQKYIFSRRTGDSMMMLCNPEDTEKCKECPEGELCQRCAIALCSTCRMRLEIANHTGHNIAHRRASQQEAGTDAAILPYCIPDALANDNMFGYASSVLVEAMGGMGYRIFLGVTRSARAWVSAEAYMPTKTVLNVLYAMRQEYDTHIHIP